MELKIRYTLGETERLKSRKQIEQLFKEGKTLSVFPLRVLYSFQLFSSTEDKAVECKGAGLQAGFTVSSRNFKKAVDRNRIKRLMREAWRLQKNELQSLPAFDNTSLVLFIIYIGKELPAYNLIHQKTAVVVKRLIKLTVENH